MLFASFLPLLNYQKNAGSFIMNDHISLSETQPNMVKSEQFFTSHIPLKDKKNHTASLRKERQSWSLRPSERHLAANFLSVFWPRDKAHFFQTDQHCHPVDRQLGSLRPPPCFWLDSQILTASV